MMKYLLFILTSLVTLNLSSQAGNDKNNEGNVTLTVTSIGLNKDEAIQNGLRNALSQTFGAFISSNTEILNDELIKDEIISVTSGNIENYNLVTEIKLKDETYSVTLSVTVSVNKLSSFIVSKGYEVEFNGNKYATNLKNMALNRANEIKVFEDLESVLDNEFNDAFSFLINSTSPVLVQSNDRSGIDIYEVTINCQSVPNDNFKRFIDYLTNTLNNLSMSSEELETLQSFKKPTFQVNFKGFSGNRKKMDGNTNGYYFRSPRGYYFFKLLQDKIILMANSAEISDGVNRFLLSNIKKGYSYQIYPTKVFQQVERSEGVSNINKLCSFIDRSYTNGGKFGAAFNFNGLKINKYGLVSTDLYARYNTKELQEIKSFTVKNGIKNPESIMSLEKKKKRNTIFWTSLGLFIYPVGPVIANSIWGSGY